MKLFLINTRTTLNLCLYRIFSLRKMFQFLLLLYSLQTRLMGSQPSADGAGLLRAEIQMDVFLASARHAEVVTREGINYSENPSNRFAYVMDLCEFRCSTTSHLLYSQLLKLRFQFFQLILKVGLALCP